MLNKTGNVHTYIRSYVHTYNLTLRHIRTTIVAVEKQ